jgi:HNH endonuclease
MTAEERLADVVGTAGSYRVSADTGDVLGAPRRARTCNQWGESTRRVPARIMSQKMHGGRATVQGCIDGQPRTILVANAVLEAFVGRRPRGYYAEHRDGDRSNNRLENLYWRKTGLGWPRPQAQGGSVSTLRD